MLAVKNIQIGYLQQKQQRIILENVSFSLEVQKIICILGSSGVGKSSLLRILAGLDRPLSGQVEISNQLITQPNPDVSMVFQSPTLLPWLNVKQNVAFGLNFHSQKSLTKQQLHQQVEIALNEVGLQDSHSLLPNMLSGGMAQRVNLARAIARKPKLILLDEPFSALDPITRSQMQEMLYQLVQKHRMAAVMITHDIDEALHIADEILLLGAIPKHPAQVVGQWKIVSNVLERDPIQLNSLRLDILRSLRQYQQHKQQEQTFEYII